MNNMDEVFSILKQQVLDAIDMSGEPEDEKINALIDEAIIGLDNSADISLASKIKLKKNLFNSLRRLDILSDILEDDSITEIMINGHDNIFVEKEGRIYRLKQAFESEERLLNIIQQIVAGCNRVVNRSSPIVDARLNDGSRVNVVLPPVSLDGAVMTIRKFPAKIMDMEKLMELNALNEETADFLKTLVRARYNIFISGGTGAGKTTFLNALSGCIPKDERIITIEDSAELQLNGIENLVRMEARNANIAGENAISIRDLIKSSLRMRPDRIIVGEVRDGAAIDMLAAMNTGHDGSLSTGHANSAEDMISRLETMCLMGAANLPIMAVRQQIASAVDIIVHLGRLRDKSRKVLEICEVLDMKEDHIQLNPLFRFVETGEETGRVMGRLDKVNDLYHVGKLRSAGLLDVVGEECNAFGKHNK